MLAIISPSLAFCRYLLYEHFQSPVLNIDSTWNDTAVQTDITMILDGGVSSFRPSYLPQTPDKMFQRPFSPRLLSATASGIILPVSFYSLHVLKMIHLIII